MLKRLAARFSNSFSLTDLLLPKWSLPERKEILTSTLFQPPTAVDRFESTKKFISVADPGRLSRIRLFLLGASKN
jgi:hypothetical protein